MACFYLGKVAAKFAYFPSNNTPSTQQRVSGSRTLEIRITAISPQNSFLHFYHFLARACNGIRQDVQLTLQIWASSWFLQFEFFGLDFGVSVKVKSALVDAEEVESATKAGVKVEIKVEGDSTN
ncbi:unnamed protein product [Rhizopus stolonifer]